MFDDFGDSLELALREAVTDLFEFIPRLVGAIILLLLGWFLGKLIGGLVTRALRAVRFNEVADKAEIDEFLRNAGVRMDPAAVVGAFVRWFIYLIFFLSAFNALGLTQVSAVIDDIIAFVPKVVVAIVVLLIGALAANLFARVVRGALRSVGIENPDLFVNIARFAVIAFAAIAALDMLEIAPTVVNGLWTALLFGIVGTLVLAFGLGGREAASNLAMGRLLRGELEPGVEVQAGAYSGTVRAVGSLFTTLETPQGVVKVPNAELASQHVLMTPEAYQQQVQKREELKQRAQQAAQEARRSAAQGDGAFRLAPSSGGARGPTQGGGRQRT